MDKSRKRGREQREDLSNKKGKKPMQMHTEPSTIEKEPTQQNLDKGKEPIQKSIYDDLVEDTNKAPLSAETEKFEAENALQDFLYEAKALHDYHNFFQMFNAEFHLPLILDHHSDYLEEYLKEFKTLTDSREIQYEGVTYIHAIDLVQDKKSETARLNKKFATIPEGPKLAINKCPKCKHKCRLFQTHAGFLVFLYLRAGQRDESDTESLDNDLEDPVSPQIASDFEDEFDLQKEKEMSKDLSLPLIRAIPTTVSVPASTQRISSLPLPLLPTYPLSGEEFVLLFDIQKSLDLREDEALAIIAQRLNFNVGKEEHPVKYREFVARDPILGKLDGCFEQAEALQLCFEELHQNKEPTEKEFEEAQKRLAERLAEAENLKKDLVTENPLVEGLVTENPFVEEPENPLVEEPESSKMTERSIDIWHEKTLVMDENTTVSAITDDFLRRTNRVFSTTKEAALKQYIGKLASPHLKIFHLRYSCSGYMPVFTLKTLSNYLGGHILHPNASKIILLARQSMFEIFGYGHAMQGSLAGRNLAYTGYALSLGVTDPAQLTADGKKYLLRNSVLETLENKAHFSTETTDAEKETQDILGEN